jgi:phosphomannomutase
VGTRDDDGFKFSLDDGSWVLMRMSGTEPLMRVYSEAASPEEVRELLAAFEERLQVGGSPPAVAAR